MQALFEFLKSDKGERWIIRIIYITIGFLVSLWLFKDREKAEVVYQERDTYRDSLVVLKTENRVIKEYLIYLNKTKDEEISSIDSLTNAELAEFFANFPYPAR